MEKYIRFDWAMKRMLRDKANFDVLEGLMTVLLEEPVKIINLLESEGNQESEDDKYNRVDIKAENSKGEIIIVEIQLRREYNFLQRILYGVSKTITEHMLVGNNYSNVKKVYSINIIYFNFGEGEDYLYHGDTKFIGAFKHDTLQIQERDGNAIKLIAPEKILPEYYIIRVNQFNQLAKTPIEEWIDYLKDGNIKDDTTVPGLQAARQKLQYIMMSKEERIAYEKHMDRLLSLDNMVETAKFDGRMEGKIEGIIEGKKEEKREMARKMINDGLDINFVKKYTGLTDEELNSLQ